MALIISEEMLLEDEPLSNEIKTASNVDPPEAACPTSTSVHLRRESHISSDSESSSSSDSEVEGPSSLKWKRRRTTSSSKPNDMAMNSRSCKAFVQQCMTQSQLPTHHNNHQSSRPSMNKFNVWSNVLAEQGLIEDLNTVGVKRLEYNDRGCEGYDFTFKEVYEGHDKLPIWKQDSKDIHRRLSCKRSVKDRLGPQLSVLKKEKRSFGVTENDSDEAVTNAIATILREQKRELIGRSVTILGKEKALEILEMTEDIEEAGGMMTVDGTRHRTPGGVYLLLIRTDADITKEDKDMIFEEDRKLQVMARKQIVKANRKKAAKPKKNAEESVTLTPLPSLSDLLMKEGGLPASDVPQDEEKQPMEVHDDDSSDRESGELDTDDDDD